jgi:hypothetical protein
MISLSARRIGAVAVCHGMPECNNAIESDRIVWQNDPQGVNKPNLG